MLVGSVGARSCFRNDLIHGNQVDESVFPSNKGNGGPAAKFVGGCVLGAAIDVIEGGSKRTAGLIKAVKRDLASGVSSFDRVERSAED